MKEVIKMGYEDSYQKRMTSSDPFHVGENRPCGGEMGGDEPTLASEARFIRRKWEAEENAKVADCYFLGDAKICAVNELLEADESSDNLKSRCGAYKFKTNFGSEGVRSYTAHSRNPFAMSHCGLYAENEQAARKKAKILGGSPPLVKIIQKINDKKIEKLVEKNIHKIDPKLDSK